MGNSRASTSGTGNRYRLSRFFLNPNLTVNEGSPATHILKMTASLLIAFLSLLAAIFGFIFNIIYSQRLYKQSKTHHNSLLFAEYTRRYQEIMIQMPDSVFNGQAEASDPGVTKYMLLYFDLCSEEFHLRSQGFIPDDVWNNWVEGMRLTVRDQTYHDAWQRLEYSYNSDFVQFMTQNIIIK